MSKRRRRQFLLLLVLQLVGAFFEVVSLGAVLPFIGVLTAPETVFSMPMVRDVAGSLSITRADQLILPLTLIFISAALLAGAFRILITWMNTRLVYAAGHDLSILAFRTTLYQPYNVHVRRNSSEVISGIDKVNSAIQVLTYTSHIVNSTLISLAILATLIAINPLISCMTFLGFAFCYASVVWITRHSLNKSSQRIALEMTRRIKVMQEALGGVREVILNGSQSFFVDFYRQSDWSLRRNQGRNTFLGACPRYAIEALAMVLIAMLAYRLSVQAGGLGSALPFLGALALGAQRLLPALQQIYVGCIVILSSRVSVNDALSLIEQPLTEAPFLAPPAPLDFQTEIQIENAFFRYTHDGPWVVKDLNLCLPKGARVGLVGTTGSGKTTTMDLLMGLLMPTSGRIMVDGLPVHGERLKAWQRIIAHVPQSIFLADTTFAENIAFGQPPEAIDMNLVKQTARQSHIADFIENNPEGYDTLVGERGIRVSGGQRQRIIIARALYKRATILVFDEATSALDNTTEREVMNAINELGRDLTILIIAHRLTTVRHCDLIVELDHGRVVAQGTYDQLLRSSNSFQEMAQDI